MAGKVLWLTGNSGAGKTTRAKELLATAAEWDVMLDGDDLRSVWMDLGFTRVDRWEQNLRVAKLARVLAEQDLNVVVATICPYRVLRRAVWEITGCEFEYLLERGEPPSAEYPYEPPMLSYPEQAVGDSIPTMLGVSAASAAEKMR